MKSTFNGTMLTFLLLFLLALQGCQRSPQSQGKADNLSSSSNGSASAQAPNAPQTFLKVGDTAPDFTLPDTEGHSVKLSDIKRQVVRAYGIFDEQRFVRSRATFVIDKNGIIRHIEQGAEAIRRAHIRRAAPSSQKRL